jgi:ribosomal-protein-alanine N-acetyltransferase
MTKESIPASPRLELVPATLSIVQADLRDRGESGRLLDARIPESWPPPLVDAAALEWTIQSLEAGPGCLRWSTRYFVLKEPRVVIGLGGFKGAPDAQGTVEIGCSTMLK